MNIYISYVDVWDQKNLFFVSFSPIRPSWKDADFWKPEIQEALLLTVNSIRFYE